MIPLRPADSSAAKSRFNRWLERFGFFEHPFNSYKAEQEQRLLGSFFIDRPYFQDVLGDPTRPQSAFLLAGSGQGKSTTCEMVAYWCQHGEFRDRVLAVPYTHFNDLLEQVDFDPARLTSRHHLRLLVRAVFVALAEEVPALFFEALDAEQAARLLGLAQAYADPDSEARLRRRLPVEPEAVDWEKLTPRETLRRLARLITSLGRTPQQGYQAVYVLVDKPDETSLPGAAAAAQILRPLVSDAALLETPGFVFKFFLSREVGERLQSFLTIPIERIPVYTISWDNAALRSVVEQRLRYYSSERVTRLADLCTPAIASKAMDELIRHCGDSPRRLLRLGDRLVRMHVERTEDALIDRIDLSRTLDDFSEQESAGPPAAALHGAATGEAEVPARGLHLDGSGLVWVDGEQLPEALPKLEYRLLRALYVRRPEVISSEDLLRQVWGSAQDNDEQTLRKLVDRLRNRLKVKITDDKMRFVRNARGRGYQLKID